MKKAYTIAFIELVGIFLLGFCSYHFYSNALNSGSSSDNPMVSSFKEPQHLTREINDTTSLMSDLESLGCKVFYLTDYNGWHGTTQPINYTDFRRIAYNTGVVFVLHFPPYVSVYSVIDGITVETNVLR
jgi:hypothetical protein